MTIYEACGLVEVHRAQLVQKARASVGGDHTPDNRLAAGVLFNHGFYAMSLTDEDMPDNCKIAWQDAFIRQAERYFGDVELSEPTFTPLPFDNEPGDPVKERG